MLSEQMQGFLLTFLEVMSALFIFVIGLGVAWLVVIYIMDVSQTKHAIRRNYPVVGHFRYFFEHLGDSQVHLAIGVADELPHLLVRVRAERHCRVALQNMAKEGFAEHRPFPLVPGPAHLLRIAVGIELTRPPKQPGSLGPRREGLAERRV